MVMLPEHLLEDQRFVEMLFVWRSTRHHSGVMKSADVGGRKLRYTSVVMLKDFPIMVHCLAWCHITTLVIWDTLFPRLQARRENHGHFTLMGEKHLPSDKKPIPVHILYIF